MNLVLALVMWLAGMIFILGQIRLWRQSFSYADRPAVFLPVEITEEVGVSQPSTTATEASGRRDLASKRSVLEGSG
jgi:hypothetical protein